MLNLARPPADQADSTDVDWAHINRVIVGLASAAAGLFFFILFAGWLFSGDDSLLVQTLTPLMVGGSGLVMLVAGRPLPLVQIGIGSAGLILFVVLSDSDVPGNPLIGLLIMAVVASVLVHRYVIGVALTSAVVLAAAGYAWHPDGTAPNDRAVMAFSLVVALVVIVWLVQYLKSRSERARNRLEELVASKDGFLATVSHELRTPLTAVVGLAHELRERWNDFSPAELAELTALLVDESTDISNIVEDLLVSATVDQGPVDIDRRVLDLDDTIRSALAAAFDVPVDRGTAPVFVVGDPLRLRQIVRNLITNALRYGGENVHVAINSNGATASVEVRDAGPPLPSEEREKIFDAYHRVGTIGGKPGSVGIGLTVSRRLARMMGGDVTYGHDGREGVFTLLLPQVSQVTPASTIVPASA